MKMQKGFTLIELILFLVVMSIVASTILLVLSAGAQKYPNVHEEIIANQTAKSCMEWFIGQRAINGYSTLTCPNTTVPGFCTAPAGYSITTNIACTTLGSDTGFKTITVTVTGVAGSVLTTLIGNY